MLNGDFTCFALILQPGNNHIDVGRENPVFNDDETPNDEEKDDDKSSSKN